MTPSLNIIERSDWGAEPRDGVALRPVTGKVSKVFTAYADSPICEDETVCKAAVSRLQIVDRQSERLPDIRFNFLVGKDQNVYEGRGWNVSPTLPDKFSKFEQNSLLIGFIGDFTVEGLPKIMDNIACDLIRFGIKNGYIKNDYQYFDIAEPIPIETQ